IQVIIEGASTKAPFLRVEVPSGKHKPYCTKGGLYKTRADGRNTPLLPPDLLAMLLEVEGRRFVERFKEATDELHDATEQVGVTVAGLQSSLNMELTSIQHDAEQARELISEKIQEVGGALDDQVMSLHEALSDAVDEQVRQLGSETADLQERL